MCMSFGAWFLLSDVPDYKTRVLYLGGGLTFETLTIEALGGSYIQGGLIIRGSYIWDFTVTRAKLKA